MSKSTERYLKPEGSSTMNHSIRALICQSVFFVAVALANQFTETKRYTRWTKLHFFTPLFHFNFIKAQKVDFYSIESFIQSLWCAASHEASDESKAQFFVSLTTRLALLLELVKDVHWTVWKGKLFISFEDGVSRPSTVDEAFCVAQVMNTTMCMNVNKEMLV